MLIVNYASTCSCVGMSMTVWQFWSGYQDLIFAPPGSVFFGPSNPAVGLSVRDANSNTLSMQKITSGWWCGFISSV